MTIKIIRDGNDKFMVKRQWGPFWSYVKDPYDMPSMYYCYEQAEKEVLQIIERKKEGMAHRIRTEVMGKRV